MIIKIKRKKKKKRGAASLVPSRPEGTQTGGAKLLIRYVDTGGG
jgi:hypothetical protein